jgi:hypothetical protein
LARVSNEVENLSAVLASGALNVEASKIIADKLNATAEKKAGLARRAEGLQAVLMTGEIGLPNLDDVEAEFRSLESAFTANPAGAREQLRRGLQDGRLVMHPQSDGSYRATGAVRIRGLIEKPRTGQPSGAVLVPDSSETGVAGARFCLWRTLS